MFYWYKHGVAMSPAHGVVEGWRDQVLDPHSCTLMVVEWRHWMQSTIDILFISKQPKICEDVTQWEAIILNLKLAIQWEEQVFKQGGVPKGSSSSGCLTLDSKKAEMEGMDSDVRKDSDNKDADGEMDDSDDSAQKWGDEGGGVVNDKSEPEQDIKMVKRKRQDSNEGAEDRAMKRKRGVSGNTLGDNCVSVKKQAWGKGGSLKQPMHCKLMFREALIKKKLQLKVRTKFMS